MNSYTLLGIVMALLAVSLIVNTFTRPRHIPSRSAMKARSRETKIGGYIWNRVCESHGHKLIKGSHAEYRDNRYVIQFPFLAKNKDHGSLCVYVEVESISGSKEVEIHIYGAAGTVDERTFDLAQAVVTVRSCLDQFAR